jgi:hypothetical protein
MDETEKAKLDLSECFNNQGAYKSIQDIAVAYFDKNIDNDSYFWHELEELIIDKIKEHE